MEVVFTYLPPQSTKQARFEWDPDKAAANLAKHGVAFEDAALVFEDPLHVSRQDRHEDGEERWQTLGLAGGVLLLVVAHAFREGGFGEEYIRVISARKATRRERKHYEHG